MPVEIPNQLSEAYREGNVVLFAGAGMSASRGAPGWGELLRRMLEWAKAEHLDVDAAGVEELIGQSDLLLAANELRTRMGDDFRKFLQKQFRDPKLTPGPEHLILPELRLAAILTTNYDKLIERAYHDAPPVHTQLDYSELAGLSRDQGFAIVKVHGDVDRVESVVLGQADYRKAMYGDAAFRAFLLTVFSTRTVLFAGCSLTDPDLLAFLEELKFQKGGTLGGVHFALMRTRGLNAIKKRNFEESYGMRIIGDAERDGFPDIAGFLGQFRDLPRSTQPAARPQAAIDVPKEEADDIASLLEAMGQRIVARRPAAGCHYFLSEYKAGAEIRRVLACYLPHAASAADVERLRQSIHTYRVDDGILLTPGPVAEEIAQPARACGIQAYGRQEYIGKLADFQPYLKKLREEYETSGIDPLFVPLKIREEAGGAAAGEPKPLDQFVDEWLAAPERNHLSLLGDFGTGKTWFSRKLAYRLAQAAGRIPIAIALRDYSRAYDIEQVLTDALTNRFDIKLGAGFKTIRRLNDEGRLLLIFDGFDEMERRASDYRTALENFWEIAKLISPRAKILLTCRTAFFRHRTEEEDILKAERGGAKVVKGDDVIDLIDRREFEVVHLTEFDDAQIQQALQRLAPSNWETVYQKIQALPKIEDLAHRPVLLDMIAKTLPRISRDEDLNLATLYERYTGELLNRRIESIAAADRQYFVQELAWDMQNASRLTVPFHEFPERVATHFGLKDDPGKAAFFERDIRTQSYLVRDDGGNYKFAHKSIMEFFVARKLSGLLAEGQATDCPLTDAIVSFVYYLLAGGYKYQRRVEGDMVYVPPGPFIFGAEREGNLRVAVVGQGFWIDRYPVTNQQFCAFLNEQGNRSEGGAEWLDHERSRIRKKGRGFTVESGFEEHPVTGVSWYGAAAFAASVGKRLPDEQEWEKAARGIDGRRYPWGEEFSVQRCNTAESGRRGTTAVGQYGETGRSVYGCEDMAGNVWEWTGSLWNEGAEDRVVRGGSWGFNRGNAACASRVDLSPHGRFNDGGFRCART